MHNADKDYSSITFIADTAQNIYSQSWLGNGRSFNSIGHNMAGRSTSLAKNFRTTTQISQAAYSLIEDCTDIIEDENFVKPYLLDKQGLFPVFRMLEDLKGQAGFISQQVSSCLKDYNLRDIAVISRFHNQIADMKK